MVHKIDFDSTVWDVGLQRLRDDDFEDLPFGSIKLDERGRVVVYNAAEAKLAQRSQEGTLGKLFFEEIAPCTNNEIFKGKLDELVRTGKKTAQFEYRFMFPWGAKFVRIQLWVPDARSRWIFVLPIEAQAPVHVPG